MDVAEAYGGAMRLIRRSTVPTSSRAVLRALALLATATLCGAVAPSALAEQRLEVIDLPSLQGNIDLKDNRLNGTDALRATVLLPDGYDDAPQRRWPLLYLLHGADDNAGTWADPRKGDIRSSALGLEGIVVMPEGGRSFFTDHWRGGSREGSNWERYFLQEVVPAIEDRYRIEPGRDHHAVMGLSMGGYGSMIFGAQLPSYFGNVGSFSGLLDTANPVVMFGLPAYSGISYARIWGAYGSAYAQAHNPTRLVGNLLDTNVLLTAGNGVVDPRIPSTFVSAVFGGAGEFGSRAIAELYYRQARAAGVPVTMSRHTGIHDWPYWRWDVRHAIADGTLFRASPRGEATPRTSFTYRSFATTGNAWGLGYRFATPPTREMNLKRNGQTVSGTGAGTLTITPGAADADASGTGSRPDCGFTAKLPFSYTLPTGC